MTKPQEFDVAVVGAGAAGLMAAIVAGRRGKRVVALDAAPRIGAKILISGGGRCNVTHDVVRAEDFNGNRNAIAKVLRAFDVAATIAFFEELGVPLKREEGGKLFPVSDRARDVVDALLGAAREAGVEIRTGVRVTSLDGIDAKHIVLATGGRSVPKTGSDGSGYALARTLGHTVTPVFPALVPLIVAEGHWARAISGTSVEAELAVKSPSGRVLHRERGSMLFTHFGVSGPVVLDVSRHFIAAQPATLAANFLPGETFESVEASLLSHGHPHATLASILRRRLPDRLVAQIASDVPLNRLTKEERRRAVRNVVDCAIPVERDRGFDYAEVTAGGVPLNEIDVSTMRSRVAENLSLVGEILDVDGKIGGYNFQWAWATGFIAGT
ncbi:MAG TPA: aminoacetone oxidase family FAD-binding enzyme [Thermoanaerobaculia bacterium]|nr:aminoacetone oxidase family FAD-binding enzyme [Thermoanaerobaculia bacterium]